MKIFITIFVLGSLISCGSQYKRPESITDKMERYKPHSTNPNVVPMLPMTANVKIEHKQYNNRRPASSVDGGVSWDNIEVPTSNKKLYFLTLLEQYQDIKKISGENNNNINHCPSFHSTWLDFNNNNSGITTASTNWEGRYSKLKSQNDLLYYPELGLPIKEKTDKPIVYDLFQKDKNKRAIIKEGLRTHLNKTYKELIELCDSGTSDNYYIYENLTTQIKRRPELFTPTTKSAHTLLRSSIFFNMALINSFETHNKVKRGPASSTNTHHTQYSVKVMKKLGVPWMKQFFKEIKNTNKY